MTDAHVEQLGTELREGTGVGVGGLRGAWPPGLLWDGCSPGCGVSALRLCAL